MSDASEFRQTVRADGKGFCSRNRLQSIAELEMRMTVGRAQQLANCLPPVGKEQHSGRHVSETSSKASGVSTPNEGNGNAGTADWAPLIAEAQCVVIGHGRTRGERGTVLQRCEACIAACISDISLAASQWGERIRH